MAEVLPVDDQVVNFDFMKWSSTDFMAFVEEVLRGPEHQAAVEIIRPLGLDGDFIGELVKEEEPMLPIAPESYQILKDRAELIEYNCRWKNVELIFDSTKGRDIQKRARGRLNAKIRQRHQEGGGANLEEDEGMSVLREIVELDPDEVGRILNNRDLNLDYVNFTTNWANATARSNRIIYVPLFDRPWRLERQYIHVPVGREASAMDIVMGYLGIIKRMKTMDRAHRNLILHLARSWHREEISRTVYEKCLEKQHMSILEVHIKMKKAAEEQIEDMYRLMNDEEPVRVYVPETAYERGSFCPIWARMMATASEDQLLGRNRESHRIEMRWL